MPKKNKKNYKSKKDISNPRDNFYTPRYATELLLPYIPSDIDYIWECAEGDGAITDILKEQMKYGVVGSDLRDENQSDFFDDRSVPDMLYKMNSAIVSNPPFGLKRKFYDRARELGRPFAFLIPLDYSGWIIDALRDGAEKIVPQRRIDFITPFICRMVYEKEFVVLAKKEMGADAKKWKKFKDIPEEVVYELEPLHKHIYTSWKAIPEELIAKHSSADFHTGWLTWGFNLGASEIFVDLPLDMKKRIF